MNYRNILQRAFKILRENRWVWLLGLMSGGSGTLFSFSEKDWQKFEKWPEKIPTGGDNLVRASDSVAKIWHQPTALFNNTTLVLTVGSALLILLLITIYLQTTAQGGLIAAAAKINAGEKLRLKTAWILGHKTFWRLLCLNLLSLFLVLLVVFTLSLPVAILAIFNLKLAAIILGIIFFLILAAFLIYFTLILPLARQNAVFKKNRAVESLVNAAALFNKNWFELLALYLILFGVAIAATIIFILAALLLIGIFILIGVLLTLITPILIAPYTGLVIALGIFILFIAFGLLNSFRSICITLAFLELSK